MNDVGLTTLRNLFEISMKLNYELFDKHAFRKFFADNQQASRSIINIALFDVMTVAFACQETSEAGNQAYHVTEFWWFGGWLAAFFDNPHGLPFLGIEHHVAWQVRAFTP